MRGIAFEGVSASQTEASRRGVGHEPDHTAVIDDLLELPGCLWPAPGKQVRLAPQIRGQIKIVPARFNRLRRQQELERHFATMPAQSWPEAADKARYLLRMLAGTTGDARIRMLIAAVLADFDRLSKEGQ